MHLYLVTTDVSDTTTSNKKLVMTSFAQNFWHQEQKILTIGVRD